MNKEYKYYKGTYKYLHISDFRPKTKIYILRKNSDVYEVHNGKGWSKTTTMSFRAMIEEISKEDAFLELL